jgi:NADPH:quinone reductase-like Zn-dependent oxidoreductase
VRGESLSSFALESLGTLSDSRLSDRELVLDSSFGQFVVVTGDFQIRIPDNISDIKAAILSVAITIAG